MTYYGVNTSLLNGASRTSIGFQVEAGGVAITCQLEWSLEVQEQYQAYQMSNQIAASSDTIGIDRSYDYIGYYLSIPEKDIAKWLSKQTVLPASLKNRTLVEQVDLIGERIIECRIVKETMDIYRDLLLWNITLTYNDEELNGYLKTGAIFTFENGVSIELALNNKDLEFTRTNLDYMYLIIGVPDGI